MQAILSWIVTFLQKEWLSFLIFLIGVLVGFILIVVLFLGLSSKKQESISQSKLKKDVDDIKNKSFAIYDRADTGFSLKKLYQATDGLQVLLSEIPRLYNPKAKFVAFKNVKFFNGNIEICLDITVYELVTFIDNLFTLAQRNIEDKILDSGLVKVAYFGARKVLKIEEKEIKNLTFADVKQIIDEKIAQKQRKPQKPKEEKKGVLSKIFKPIKALVTEKVVNFGENLFDEIVAKEVIGILAEELNSLYSGNIERRYKKDDENTALIVKEEAV